MESLDGVRMVLSRYRDPALARRLVQRIWDVARDLPRVRIMHVCGTLPG